MEAVDPDWICSTWRFWLTRVRVGVGWGGEGGWANRYGVTGVGWDSQVVVTYNRLPDIVVFIPHVVLKYTLHVSTKSLSTTYTVGIVVFLFFLKLSQWQFFLSSTFRKKPSSMRKTTNSSKREPICLIQIVHPKLHVTTILPIRVIQLSSLITLQLK